MFQAFHLLPIYATDFSLFRDRLAEACRIRGVTHDAVASELVAAAFLDLQFARSRTLDLYRVCQIADRLDVSVDWLVGRSDVMELQKDEKRKPT